MNGMFDVPAGYENASGEWDEYSPYVNTEGLDIGSPVSWVLHYNLRRRYVQIETHMNSHCIFSRASTMTILLCSIQAMATLHKCHMGHILRSQLLCLLLEEMLSCTPLNNIHTRAHRIISS